MDVHVLAIALVEEQPAKRKKKRQQALNKRKWVNSSLRVYGFMRVVCRYELLGSKEIGSVRRAAANDAAGGKHSRTML